MASPVVKLEGLKEFRRDLMRLDRENVPKAMVQAGLTVSEPIAAMVRVRLPRRTGNLAGTVRTAKIRTGAALRVGTAGVPYVGPVEFGGYPGRRPFYRDGRYIFPTVRAMSNGVVESYARAIQEAIDRNGWYIP